MNWQPIETAPQDKTLILITDGVRFGAGTRWVYVEPKTLGVDYAEPPWNFTGPEWERWNNKRQNPKAGQSEVLYSSIGCSAWDEDTEVYDGEYNCPTGIMRPTHWAPMFPPPPREGTHHD